jgi:hypothetical protein
MSKVKIRVSIQTIEGKQIYETMALFHDNILKYQEEDNTMVKLNLEKNDLTRENNNLKMYYHFDLSQETEGIIEIKEYQKEIRVKIKTERLERKKNDIKYDFQVEENHYQYHIEVLV